MTTGTRSALYTPLCDLLGIRYPICQAGMGFVARSGLAAAVSEAGGLGVLAAAHNTPEELREEIRRVRDATDKPFGVDVLFATMRAAGEEVDRFTDAVRGSIDVALEERVPVLIAGLGNPGAVTTEAHRLGMKVMALCIQPVIRKAWLVLEAGGEMHLIGEMLDAERTGPADPALWGLAEAVYGSTGIAHSVTECVGYLEAAGFTGVTAHEFIPGVLIRVTGAKPA
jgi:hypothetical protein